MTTGPAKDFTMPTYIIQIFEENDTSDDVLNLSIEADSAEDALAKLQSGDAEMGEIDDDELEDGEAAEVELRTRGQAATDLDDMDENLVVSSRRPLD